MHLEIDKTYNMRFSVSDNRKVGLVFSFRPPTESITECQQMMLKYFSGVEDFADTAIAVVAMENELKVRRIPTKVTYFTHNYFNLIYLSTKLAIVFLRATYRMTGRDRFHEAYKLPK